MPIARALVALARAAAVLVPLGLMWPFLAGYYNQLLIRAAQFLTPREVTVGSSGRSITFVYRGGQEMGQALDGFTLHFGLILVVTLVAATPGLKPLSRLSWVLITLAFFVILHSLTLGLFSWVAKWTGDGGGPLTIGFFLPAYTALWGLIPAVFAAAWCVRFWLPSLRATSAPAQHSSIPE